MPEGIKLYEHFKKQIEKMHPIKRAWFTTFNLDISFFEKYILSALVGISYENLKTVYDYEALNTNLANDNESLNNDKIEVKVFYDYRALMITSKPKQTSIHLHAIDLKLISGLNSNRKFTEGVFHPKVTLIETYNGDYWLMVSSANLTFGGWSRNRESFFCDKIEDKDNAREVKNFFDNIISSVKDNSQLPLPQRLASNTFPKENSKWYFFSSFSNDSFINQLNNTNNKVPLTVWSPYFSDDLPDLVEELQTEHFSEIQIIPAVSSKNENQKIRITKDSYLKCAKKEGVTFRKDKLPNTAQECFVHAKVWLAPKALAIGSWNMTRSGINESEYSNNNIEAGIIYQLKPSEYDEILVKNPTSALVSPNHFKKEELEKEKDEILDKFALSVDLILDWDELSIQIQNPSYSKLLKQIDSNDIIKLPGKGKLKISRLENPIDIRDYKHTYLIDRFFEIESKNGKILYKGYIREINLDSRPVNSFENIDDYLKGWVLEAPEDKEELHRLAYNTEESTDDLNIQTKKNLFGDEQNAWFTSFHAFECILKRINRSREFYVKEKKVELKRIGRILPGSLSELRTHLEFLLKTYQEDKCNFIKRKSPIYLWFLVEKANYVFKYFNEEINIEREKIKKLKNIEFENLLLHAEAEKIGKENLEKWKNYIISKLNG